MRHNNFMIQGGLVAAVGIGLVSSEPAAPAQTANFDIASFTPPSGWQTEQRRDFVAYTHTDGSRGLFCRLAVYVGDASIRDPERQFAREWQDIVAPMFSARLPAASEGRTKSGLIYLAGGGRAEQGGKAYYAHLLVFTAAPKTVSVLTLVPDRVSLDTYLRPIQAFLESVRFSGAAPLDQQPHSPSNREPPAVRDVGSTQGGGLSGVWMGFRQMQLLGNYAPDTRWMTFFNEGQAMDDIPWTGLDGFDRGASKANANERPFWGTYAYRDGDGVFKRLLVGAFDTRIKDVKPGQIKLDDLFNYYRCASVEGLRLDGAWAGYADPEDPRWRSVPFGHRMVFRFGKDGRFTDEGVFATLLTADGRTAESGPGSGTYEIRSFTLILHYSNGRLKKAAFTGFMTANPATENKILYIGKAQFNKMK